MKILVDQIQLFKADLLYCCEVALILQNCCGASNFSIAGEDVMPQLHANTACFIKGAPLRKPEYFIGPVAWWTGSLTCGGVERQIMATARAFKENGHPIVLLCRTLSAAGSNDFFLTEAKACCKAVLEFSLDKINMEDFMAARQIMKAAFDSPPPVFRDSVAAYAAWFLRVRPRVLQVWNADHIEPLLAAVIAGVPNIVIAGQSLSPAQRAPYGFESVDENMAFVLLGNIMRMPGVLMTNNSRAGCAAYEGWMGLAPGTVMLTPNIFDMSQWPRPDTHRVQALRQAIGLPEHARLLGGLFRFVSIKDPELWVCTAMRACALHEDLYAVVGGNGPALADIKEAVGRSPYADRILFPGSIKDVPAFLSLCSVFLHTAHVEGLPNVLVEALAYEVPVVTTRCGGAADVVTHGQSGFVVDERDDAALAKHVDYVLKHADFAQKAGKAGRDHVERSFSPERGMEMLHRVYERIEGTPAPVETKRNGTASCSSVEMGEAVAPLVSVVLPTYNHLAFLPQAVNSVLAQDYENFELIIVDDGSTDGTAAYLDSIISSRIRVLSGQNTRLPTALNRGFAVSRGEYLTWTSADNICMPHFCSVLSSALSKFPRSGFVSASFLRIGNAGQIIDRLSGEAFLDNILCCNSGIAAFMYRKSVAVQAGEYNPDLEGAEDWDMWLRILEVAPSVHVPEALYQYRWHDDSMRVKLSNKVLEASTRVAFRALQRLEQRGGVYAIFPQIDRCRDQELALFHANLVLGSRMIESGSFLKGAAAGYLEAAHRLHPDDLTAMGNYAVALAWQGKYEMASELLQRGKPRAPEAFNMLRESCVSQRKHVGTYKFHCPTLPTPGPETSELLQYVSGERSIFLNQQRSSYAF